MPFVLTTRRHFKGPVRTIAIVDAKVTKFRIVSPAKGVVLPFVNVSGIEISRS